MSDAAEQGAREGGAGARGGGATLHVVSGRLSDAELAAVTVALAALNAASRAEAEERGFLLGEASPVDGWMDPIHRLPGMHDARRHAGESAWAFSHR